MERLLGPNLNSRLAYVPAGGALLSAAGTSAVVFANPTGPTLADIQIYNGTNVPAGPVPNSTLTVDSDSLIPLFWFPENTDIVYIEVNGGTRTPANADYDFRIDNVSGFVNAPMISTGIISGGALSTNALDPNSVDIAPLQGYIVDYATNDASPTITPVKTTSPLTVPLDAGGLLRPVTFWLMDATQGIIQQAVPPTNEQRRTHLQLGFTVRSGGVIVEDQTGPVILSQPMNQFYDLMYALGAFNVSGNALSGNANLTMSKTNGFVFAVSARHETQPNNPHILVLPAQNPVQFRNTTQSLTGFGPITTILDVANFDVGGVVTPVGGGTNRATNFRIFGIAQETVANQIMIQYGQQVYASLAAAVQDALNAGSFVKNPTFGRAATYLGVISVIHTATNLSDPLQAVFTRVGKFDLL